MELLLHLGFWLEQLLSIVFTSSQQRNPDIIIFCDVIFHIKRLKNYARLNFYLEDIKSMIFFRNSMRADSIATSNIKNRIGSKGSLEKVADVRLLLEEKRQNNSGPRQPNSTVKSGNFVFYHSLLGRIVTKIHLLHTCAPLQINPALTVCPH